MIPIQQFLAPSGELRPEGRELLKEFDAIKALELMVLSRATDERAIELQMQGRLRVYAPVRGQEAVALGPAMAVLPERDWLVPAYREFPAYIHHGLTLTDFWLTRMGYGALLHKGPNVRMLPIQISVAAQIPQAVGLAKSLMTTDPGAVVIVYFGDGATSEGDFHEALNLSGVMKAPVVFVCANNGWAITTDVQKQTASGSIAGKADAYGIEGVRVDGNDLVAMFWATRNAVKQARNGNGPTLIEGMTYRMGMHNTSDDPSRYMDTATIEDWESRDPIVRLASLLESVGAIATDEVERLRISSRTALDGAYDEALEIAKAVDPVGALFDNVYDQTTEDLDSQRSALEEYVGDT